MRIVAHINARIVAHINARIIAHINARIVAHIYARIVAHINARIVAHINARIFAQRCAYLRIYAHTYAYMRNPKFQSMRIYAHICAYLTILDMRIFTHICAYLRTDTAIWRYPSAIKNQVCVETLVITVHLRGFDIYRLNRIREAIDSKIFHELSSSAGWFKVLFYLFISDLCRYFTFFV